MTTPWLELTPKFDEAGRRLTPSQRLDMARRRLDDYRESELARVAADLASAGVSAEAIALALATARAMCEPSAAALLARIAVDLGGVH